MFERLKRLMPDPESLRGNRWVAWLGPRLYHPRLWHMSRKGIALGMAVGVFFGLLIPVAQMPFSATLAVLLRANLPVAMASTLVTNPVTFGPVYFGAYKLGKFVLGKEKPNPHEIEALLAKQAKHEAKHEAKNDDMGFLHSIQYAWNQLGKVGKPLIVGLAIVASITGVLVYFLVHGLWTLKVRWQRRRRLDKQQESA